MKVEQVKAAIAATPKGANVILEWVRPLKERKTNPSGATITKSVRMVGRMGIEYDNQKVVQGKRESGVLPAENQGLKWGFWSEYPWLQGHNKGLEKEDPAYEIECETTGYYIRLYKGTSEKVKPEVHFFKNGVECSLDELKPHLLKSEIDSEHGDCFSCKLENMTRIHAEAEWHTIVVGQVGQEKTATTIPIPAKTLATM